MDRFGIEVQIKFSKQIRKYFVVFCRHFILTREKYAANLTWTKGLLGARYKQMLVYIQIKWPRCLHKIGSVLKTKLKYIVLNCCTCVCMR